MALQTLNNLIASSVSEASKTSAFFEMLVNSTQYVTELFKKIPAQTESTLSTESNSYTNVQHILGQSISKRSLAEGAAIILKNETAPLAFATTRKSADGDHFGVLYYTNKNDKVDDFKMQIYNPAMEFEKQFTYQSLLTTTTFSDINARITHGNNSEYFVLFKKPGGLPTQASHAIVYAGALPYHSNTLMTEAEDTINHFEASTSHDRSRLTLALSETRKSDDKKIVKLRYFAIPTSDRVYPLGTGNVIAEDATVVDVAHFTDNDIVTVYQKGAAIYWQQHGPEPDSPQKMSETLLGNNLSNTQIATLDEGSDQYLACVSIDTNNQVQINVLKNKAPAYQKITLGDTTSHTRHISKPTLENGELMFGVSEEISNKTWASTLYRFDFKTGKMLEQRFEVSNDLMTSNPYLDIIPISNAKAAAFMVDRDDFSIRSQFINTAHLTPIDTTSMSPVPTQTTTALLGTTAKKGMSTTGGHTTTPTKQADWGMPPTGSGVIDQPDGGGIGASTIVGLIAASMLACASIAAGLVVWFKVINKKSSADDQQKMLPQINPQANPSVGEYHDVSLVENPNNDVEYGILLPNEQNGGADSPVYDSVPPIPSDIVYTALK